MGSSFLIQKDYSYKLSIPLFLGVVAAWLAKARGQAAKFIYTGSTI